jgi:hypothetical protein
VPAFVYCNACSTVQIPDAADALLKFGGVAKSSNISIEESVALIQALGPSFKSSEELGTGLRNIMLKLSAPDALPKEAQKAMEALGINFQKVTDKATPFKDRLEAMKPLLKDEAALIKVFGTENIIAAKAALTLTDSVGKLTDGMDRQGTTSEQADARTQTLSHALTQLKGAWNEVVLSFMNGSGSTKVLTSSIKFLANNLGTILSVLGKLVVAWGAYKTLQLSLQLIEKARAFSFAEFGRNLAAQIPMTKQYAAAQKEAAAATKEAGTSAKAAGSAMSAVPWMAIIAVLVEVALAFYDIASGAAAAREAQARLDKTVEGSAQLASSRSQNRQAELQKEIAKQQRLRNENKITEEQFLKRKQYAINLTQKQIQEDIKAVNQRKKGYVDEANRLEDIQRRYAESGKFGITEAEGEFLLKNNLFGENLTDRIAQLRANAAGATEKIKEYRKELEVTGEAQKDATSELIANTSEQDINTGKIGAKIPKMKELNTEMEKYNEYLTKQNELLYEQDQFDTEQQIKTLNDEIKNLTDEALMLAEAGIVPDTSLLQAKMQERLELEKDLIGEKLKMELQAIEDRYKAESDKAREQITSNYQKLIGQDGLTPAERKKIDDQYKAQLAQFDLDELQRNADKQLELKLTKEKALAEGVELDKKFGEETIQVKNDVNDKLTESEQRRIDRENKKKEEEQEKLKKRLENQNAWIKWTADYFIEQSNRKIAQIDKEIAAAENQQNILQELAANGNINARESLAEQQKIIDQANRRKEQEQRRQQMIELVSGVWLSTSAITSISLLANSGVWTTDTKFALYGIKG